MRQKYIIGKKKAGVTTDSIEVKASDLKCLDFRIASEPGKIWLINKCAECYVAAIMRTRLINGKYIDDVLKKKITGNSELLIPNPIHPHVNPSVLHGQGQKFLTCKQKIPDHQNYLYSAI